eukprot:TRINITY_DN44364_c0_g1_i1.p1 TRINITY_DN44364_c0_g1~~TRINITY_DN44364_c0_g1_i1.p1  ORF type:complete len:305 (+),score=67.70 TRINITY_DN44364_c0_g1_i1:69-983(+)
MEAEAREAMLKELVEVLDARSSGAARTLQIWVGSVEPKQANTALKRLDKERPMKRHGVEFLRRITKSRETGKLEMLFDTTSEGHEDYGLSDMREISVAAEFPRTPEEWRDMGALWPLSKPAPTPSPTRPDKFQPATLLRIQEAFKSLVAAAAKHGTQHVCMVYSSEWDVVATAVGGADTGYTLRGAVKGETAPRFALDHCVTQAIAAVASAQFEEGVPVSKRRKADQYLLTGYKVFCTEEPCVMCVMSLLHSRCGALYYLKKNTKFGGAGGLHCVHSEEKLNHHFPAYCYSNTELCAALEGMTK